MCASVYCNAPLPSGSAQLIQLNRPLNNLKCGIFEGSDLGQNKRLWYPDGTVFNFNIYSMDAVELDELPVSGSSVADINTEQYEKFIQTKYGRSLEDMGVDLPKSLENLNLLSEGTLTLAGLLLFSDRRHQFRPQFSIHCVSVDGDDTTGNTFSDTEDPIDGNLLTVFQKAMGFVDRNMRKLQAGPSFNSPAKWEIPYGVFEELLVNSLIHRDYFIQSTIKIFIFKNRVEIHSPGKLPNSLTIENVRNGISIARNPVLQSVAQFVLPYKGLGTGISRALALYPDIEFINDMQTAQFRVVIKRP